MNIDKTSQETQENAQASAEIINIINTQEKDSSFLYQLTDKLRSDCDYYLGAGNGLDRFLWSGTVEQQIIDIKALWNNFETKPEWLTMEQIEELEKKMQAKRSDKQARK